jgi:hypothetical protein
MRKVRVELTVEARDLILDAIDNALEGLLDADPAALPGFVSARLQMQRGQEFEEQYGTIPDADDAPGHAWTDVSGKPKWRCNLEGQGCGMVSDPEDGTLAGAEHELHDHLLMVHEIEPVR